MSLSYRNQSTDVQSKSIDCFLYDRALCHERVNENIKSSNIITYSQIITFTAMAFFILFKLLTISNEFRDSRFLFRNSENIV